LCIDCRGLGAKPALPGLRGIRGEVARVRVPGLGITRPVRLLHPRYPIYIAPKQDDLYVIGATEIESEDMSPVSVRSALELLSAAFSVHPGFGEARIVELNSQCRPTLPDHRPAIVWQAGGAEQGDDAGAGAGRGGARDAKGDHGVNGTGRFAVNGLYRHGFMIAPEVVQQATDLALAWLNGELRGESNGARREIETPLGDAPDQRPDGAPDRRSGGVSSERPIVHRGDGAFDAWRSTARWPALLSREIPRR
jgi:glycine oxidase